MKGILGKKIGMTQVFTKEGKLIPVTVIEVEPNVVTQIKTVEKDGYEAVQLATDTIREGLSNKPAMGHTNKANTTPKRFLKEIRGVNVNDYTLGQTIGVDVFSEGELVDVTGTSKVKVSKVLLNVTTNQLVQWDMVLNIIEVLVHLVLYYQCTY